jgi:CheY-like chemotaxis protein
MNYQGMNILLVEDSQVNQVIAKAFLQKMGMVVTIAQHGRDALNKIVSKIFQAVLMDIQMPEMDGFVSSSKIRAMDDSYFKSVPIFAFSASGIKEIKDEAIRHGMNDVINKPIIIEELREKISQYVIKVRRELFINFEQYTDGDLGFKKELVSLMINNIQEFQQSLFSGVKESFLSVSHKVKATIAMLNDSEFTDMADEFKSLIKSHSITSELNDKRSILNMLCNDIVDSLTFEGGQ